MAHNRRNSIEQVVDLVVKEGVFSIGIVNEEVQYFYNELGLHPKYFDHFDNQQIAKHINCLMAAKRVAMTTKSSCVKFHIEEDAAAFYLTSLNQSCQQETEALVTKYLQQSDDVTTGFSVVFMASKKPFRAGGDQCLAIYIVDRTKFDIVENKIERLSDEDDLALIASAKFMQSKSPECQKMYQELIRKLLNSRSTITNVEPVSQGGQREFVLQFSVYETSCKPYIQEINQVFRNLRIIPRRFYVETFANGIVTCTCYFPQENINILLKACEMLRLVAHFKQTPNRSERLWDLVIQNKIDAAHCIFLLAGVKYVFTFFPKESQEYLELAAFLKNNLDMSAKLDEIYKQAVADQLTVEAIYDAFVQNVTLTRAIFDDFRAIAYGTKKPQMNGEILTRINEVILKPLDRKIFKCLLTFNENIRMTNFFKYAASPSAIAFRFDGNILGARSKTMFPEKPYGIYMIMGRGFYGFHVRFRDVARGGIRLIKSRDKNVYERNVQTLFEENYNLAYTQQQKNKDIPEGGSKGTILLDSDWVVSYTRAVSAGRDACFKYFDAMLDCMLAEEVGLASHLEKPEILFFGPDEGTAEFMDMGATRAKERGYPYWKALTTGKSTHYGGVPHDVYGMTTCGIHTYVVELLKWFNEDETKIRKFMTGGPDGDLGSNEILMSKDKTIGIVDGSGVAYSPGGLSREELVRLARERLSISNYRPSLLVEKGSFLVKVDDKDVKLPDGSVWRTGAELRDKFHLTDYASADLFVPCGGRPAAVNAKNVAKLFSNGKPKFRYIVEGANLFFTDDARRVLEQAGVHLFKDASANKGGVTSSSLEVFASLCMVDYEHQTLLTVSEGEHEAPQFYQEYVKEIITAITRNCRLEFRTIMNAYTESVNNGEPALKMDLTRKLSYKINRLGDYIMTVLDDPKNTELKNKALKRAIPSLILKKFDFEHILDLTPTNYLQAMAAVWMASRYIYQYGIDATEFSFYRFMKSVETEDFAELDKLESATAELPSRRASFSHIFVPANSKDPADLTPCPHKYPPKVKQLPMKERIVTDPSKALRKGTRQNASVQSMSLSASASHAIDGKKETIEDLDP